MKTDYTGFAKSAMLEQIRLNGAATLIEEITAGLVVTTYVGWAGPGCKATSTSDWRIMKMVEDSSTPGTVSTTITYADGNMNFDNEWDERVSLTYSYYNNKQF